MGEPRARRPLAAWVWALPALAAIALYARTIGYAFVWDDLDLIVRDAVLQGGRWMERLSQDFWQVTGGGSGMWRPLVTLSFRTDGALSGWHAWSFHAVNVGLCAATAALVAWLALARGAPRPVALGAGLVFATAPALSESTAWIAGRSDALVALLALAALALERKHRAGALRAAGSPPAASRLQASPILARVGSVAAVALALLAKESALVVPLLLAADAVDDGGDRPAERGASPAASRAGGGGAPALAHAARSAWLASWPLIGVVALWATAHRSLVPGSSHPPDPGAAAGMAALVWAHLVWLAPWAPHSPLLDLWHAPSAPVAGVAWVGLGLVTVLSASLLRRRLPLLLPISLVFLPLAPVAAASLVESGVRFAERELALPVAGLALGAAWLATRTGASRRGLALAVLAAWVGLQAAATWPAIGAWRDEESRIRRVAAVRPNDPDALLGMADLLSSEGRGHEAMAWIERAEAVAPRSAAPLVARSALAYRANRAGEALALAERAVALEPADLAAGVLRVRSLVRLGRADEAGRAADALAAAHPDAPAAQGALGEARLAGGNPEGALAPLELASSHLLDDGGLAWDLGRAAIATGRVELAHTAFERAVVAAPEWYDAWLAVADTRSRVGDSPGAERALARAAALPGAGDGRVEALREILARRARR